MAKISELAKADTAQRDDAFSRFDVTIGDGWALIRGRGTLLFKDLLAAIRANFPNPCVRNVVWDLSTAHVSEMPRGELEALAREATRSGSTRAGARTSFVSKETETYARICLYVGIAGLEDVPIEYCVFRHLDEALRWTLDPQQFDHALRSLRSASKHGEPDVTAA